MSMLTASRSFKGTGTTSKGTGRTKVLLLHPEDNIPLSGSSGNWDVVVYFGHAPDSTYERWSREAGTTVIGIYSFLEKVGDLSRVRALLQLGTSQVVDRFGIDWWDALSGMIWFDLFQLLLVYRLARELGSSCDLYVSRPMPEATVLEVLLDVRTINLESPSLSAWRRIWRPFRALSRLNATQAVQVLQDKFDGEHTIRSSLARRKKSSGRPVVLLPSAYVNVSRTAVAFGRLLPDDDFLLVCARRSAKIKPMPANIRMSSLDAYFKPPDQAEVESLLQSWQTLKAKLASTAREFETAGAAGMLDRFPALLRWGIVVRDAWRGVFGSENIAGCLCADDSNPYTLIPLILAKNQGIPTLACHHGALDYAMAVKSLHADFYLAKSEMEQDYLLNVCRVASERIVVGGPVSSKTTRHPPASRLDDRPWVVLFTQPYFTPWRTGEAYEDLVQGLVSLCQSSGLRLILKLHPFENAKNYGKWLRRWLPPESASEVDVVTGEPSSELWKSTRFALTVQSSVAVECAMLGIPVFLCAWLREPYGAYLEQYAKFGVGQILQSVAQIADIPRLIEGQVTPRPVKDSLLRAIEPTILHNLLHGVDSSQAAAIT